MLIKFTIGIPIKIIIYGLRFDQVVLIASFGEKRLFMVKKKKIIFVYNTKELDEKYRLVKIHIIFFL